MLPPFCLLRLRFELEITEEVHVPAFKTDMLRQALLWHLGSVWCRRAERCRHGCEDPEHCLFGKLLEPVAGPNLSTPVRRLMGPTPPPAYVLWDMGDRRSQFSAGDMFRFEITLLGDLATRQMPTFVAALMAGAEQGIGRQRLKGRLKRVDLFASADQSRRPLLIDGAWQGDATDGLHITSDTAHTWADRVSVDEPLHHLSIRYLTPFNTKLRGKLVERPDLSPVMRAVVRRLRILSEVHGSGEWPESEWGPLLNLADRVRLEWHETEWSRTARYSRRGMMLMYGFAGPAWYASDEDLRPLLPALWLGQWVHAGKAAVWGMGRYEIGFTSPAAGDVRSDRFGDS